MVRIDTLARARIHRGVQHLHTLGPNATGEFLADVADRIGGLPAIVGLLEEYQQRAVVARKVRRTGKRKAPAAAASVTVSCVVLS
jgi:hypothetical protein